MQFKFIVLLGLITLTIGSCRKVNQDCNNSLYPNAPAQEWFKSHNGSEEESHGHFILSCSDGGFLQVGETGEISNSTKILAVKTNSDGELLWSQEISTGNHNLGNSAMETPDGYLIFGSQNKNSSITKLNKSNGVLIWNKLTDNGGADAFEHGALTNNGIIGIGYRNAEDDNNTFFTQGDGYLTLLNNQGEKINGIQLNLAHPYRIEPYNTEYFVSGLTENAADFGLIKIDSIGNTIWMEQYGGDKADHCFGMDVAADGYVFLTGHTLSGTDNWDTYTLKISNNGDLVWESKTGNPRGFNPKFIHDEAWGIRSTVDGGCIIAAGTGDEYGRYRRRCGSQGDNSNRWHVYVIKYNSIGQIDWQRTIGGGKGIDWAGEDIDLTPNGGAIIAVDNGEFGFLLLEPFL